ncbi:hypothetical protein ACQPXM_02370 [Kribbella sp. CA-253562]|uniref:hypothetical protein n=1 Tax=Kribbella sp. CA-253562 TaxID=3239942 RepID=UPI003D947C73
MPRSITAAPGKTTPDTAGPGDRPVAASNSVVALEPRGTVPGASRRTYVAVR